MRGQENGRTVTKVPNETHGGRGSECSQRKDGRIGQFCILLKPFVSFVPFGFFLSYPCPPPACALCRGVDCAVTFCNHLQPSAACCNILQPFVLLCFVLQRVFSFLVIHALHPHVLHAGRWIAQLPRFTHPPPLLDRSRRRRRARMRRTQRRPIAALWSPPGGQTASLPRSGTVRWIHLTSSTKISEASRRKIWLACMKWLSS